MEDNTLNQDRPPKIFFTLVDSDIRTEGIVKVFDSGESLPPSTQWMQDKGDVVGIWDRLGDGTYYIEVTTPVEALQDSVITSWVKWMERDRAVYAENRPASIGKDNLFPHSSSIISQEAQDSFARSLLSAAESQSNKLAHKSRPVKQSIEEQVKPVVDVSSLRDKLSRLNIKKPG
jgi:hypothetical protein